MPGLDRNILDNINHVNVIDRVKLDLKTDFILAPHYNTVLINAVDELWSLVNDKLRSGLYHPELPLTMSVPKERGFTRPGSILQPIDRFVHQALIDIASPYLEEQLDRTRTFSHVLSEDDDRMFMPAHDCWENFQEKLGILCQQGGYILKADIANYFERIPQHHLINLMNAANCPSSVVNLMEEMLLSFQERDSFGIVQGIFPSDVLGNFFLSDIDAYCDLNNIGSARYVDDIFMQFSTIIEAKKGLIKLIEQLRQDGLHLNEYKTGIHTADSVLREETEVDELFDAAREEVREELTQYYIETGYGFSAEWQVYDEPEEEDVEFEATERLYSAIEDHPEQSDKIEKFCLPLLRASSSDIAINSVLSNLIEKPHLTRLYHAYLSKFTPENTDLVSDLERLVNSQSLITDYQRMYLLGSMINAPSIQRETTNSILQWLQNPNVAKETRSLSALFIAKHGNANQKRAVRQAYENEQSSYVRSAILYSSRYFTTAEKKTCKRAWGGHSYVNALISKSI